jgi:hypothetical protein
MTQGNQTYLQRTDALLLKCSRRLKIASHDPEYHSSMVSTTKASIRSLMHPKETKLTRGNEELNLHT